MSKGRMRIIGYDGQGEPIKRRRGPRVEPERQHRERPSMKAMLRQGFRAEVEDENTTIARTLGIRVR